MRFGLVCALLGFVFAACGGSSTAGSGGAAGSAGTGASAGSGGATGGSGGTAGSAGTGGAPTDWTKCDKPSDCVLLSLSCCGSCGAVTRGDAQALNQQGATAYLTDKCADVDCPGCYQPQDPTLLATCEAGSCVVVDLLQHASTACSSANDCRLRTTDCCECGGTIDDEHLIAVSNTGTSFDPLVCDPGTGCPECAPVYPDKPLECVQGHCKIAVGTP